MYVENQKVFQSPSMFKVLHRRKRLRVNNIAFSHLYKNPQGTELCKTMKILRAESKHADQINIHRLLCNIDTEAPHFHNIVGRSMNIDKTRLVYS